MTSPEDGYTPSEEEMKSSEQRTRITEDNQDTFAKALNRGKIGEDTAYEGLHARKGNMDKVMENARKRWAREKSQRLAEKLEEDEPPIITDTDNDREHVRPIKPIEEQE